LKLDLSGLKAPEKKQEKALLNIEGFVSDLEKGVKQNKFPPTEKCWRVSSLVQIWGSFTGKAREERLYKQLVNGTETDFEVETLKRFHIGHKVHDIVKEYFESSPEFKVIKDEWGIKHPTLPITGTMDHILEWNKYPNQEIIAEIKSVESSYHNNQYWGSKLKPFKKAKWQSGIYAEIYGAPAVVVYYCKDNSEIVAHLNRREEYFSDVTEIFETCHKVYEKYKKENPVE
jgi:hypothetical protein